MSNIIPTREVQTELELPSGLKVVVYKGKGKDIIAASRLVDTQRDGSFAMLFALASIKCTFDGDRRPYEDILELSDQDAFALLGALMGNANKVPGLELPGVSSPPITSPN